MPDMSKYTGSITYTGVTTTSPASFHWGIDELITYVSGPSGTTIFSSTASIVDTGTTLVLIATDAYNHCQSATGATLDNATGLLKNLKHQLRQSAEPVLQHWRYIL